MDRVINFSDIVDNGILFSQICASLLRENKQLLKEVCSKLFLDKLH